MKQPEEDKVLIARLKAERERLLSDARALEIERRRLCGEARKLRDIDIAHKMGCSRATVERIPAWA